MNREWESGKARPARTEHPCACHVFKPNLQTIDFVKSTDCQTIAEIGVYKGYTSELLAEHLSGQGELHLFDFRHRVTEVKGKLNAAGY